MTALDLIASTIAKRRAAGLEVEITYPDRDATWTGFAPSHAQAQRWLASATAKRLPCRILPGDDRT